MANISPGSFIEYGGGHTVFTDVTRELEERVESLEKQIKDLKDLLEISSVDPEALSVIARELRRRGRK